MAPTLELISVLLLSEVRCDSPVSKGNAVNRDRALCMHRPLNTSVAIQSGCVETAHLSSRRNGGGPDSSDDDQRRNVSHVGEWRHCRPSVWILTDGVAACSVGAGDRSVSLICWAVVLLAGVLIVSRDSGVADLHCSKVSPIGSVPQYLSATREAPETFVFGPWRTGAVVSDKRTFPSRGE
jgi:hypothetical protein